MLLQRCIQPLRSAKNVVVLTRQFHLSTTAHYGDSKAARNEDDWHPEEVQRWEFGRNKLAAMMGEETLNELQVEKALHYLLPTRLSARDARPLMKHPSHVFDKRKESAFDTNGRPLEAAFYTGFPAYHNLIFLIYQMTQHLDNQLPEHGTEGEEREETPTPKFWVKRRALANILAEEISEFQYRDLLSRLTLLASHPRSSAIADFLDQFRRPHFSHISSSKPAQPNSHGYIRSVGRRKSSVAVVHLARGGGGVMVNSEPLLLYFPQAEHRQQVLFPLVQTELLGGVAVNAEVRGGGKTGQAGALRLAISKALAGIPGEHHSRLEGAGLLVRDPRAVERKKPGQKKARKKFAWVKR